LCLIAGHLATPVAETEFSSVFAALTCKNADRSPAVGKTS